MISGFTFGNAKSNFVHTEINLLSQGHFETTLSSRAQLSNSWQTSKSLSKIFGPVMRMCSFRRFQRKSIAYMWVSSQLLSPRLKRIIPGFLKRHVKWCWLDTHHRLFCAFWGKLDFTKKLKTRFFPLKLDFFPWNSIFQPFCKNFTFHDGF